MVDHDRNIFVGYYNFLMFFLEVDMQISEISLNAKLIKGTKHLTRNERE